MELKWLHGRCVPGAMNGFNCTFMELKFATTQIYLHTNSGFNCTFMELKSILQQFANASKLF